MIMVMDADMYWFNMKHSLRRELTVMTCTMLVTFNEFTKPRLLKIKHCLKARKLL
jgi:hypothetical protein